MAIDKNLREQLIARGMQDKLTELETANKKGGFLAFIKEANKQFYNPGSESQKKVIAPVAKIIAPLGETIGASLAKKEILDRQKESVAMDISLHQKTLQQLRDPKLSSLQKYRALAFNAQSNPNMIEQVPEINKTAKQIFGEGAVTALNTVAGLSTAGNLQATGSISKALINFSNTVNKLGKAKDATKISKLAGITLRGVKTAAEGAAFGSAVAIEQGKETKEEIVKEAGLFAGISLFAPPILGRVFKGSSEFIGNIAKVANKRSEELIPLLKVIAEKKPKGTGNFLIDTANSTKASFKNSAAEFGARVLEQGTKPLEPALIDRMYNIKIFDEFAESITKTKISNTPNSAYIKARNFAGIEGKYTVAAKDFQNIVDNEYKPIKDELLGYVKGLDLLNRANRGQAIEVGLTAKEIQKQLVDIEQRVIAKGGTIEELQAGVSAYNEFTKKNILGEFLDSGLISKTDADNILEANPNWTPHDVLDFYENRAGDAFLKGGSFNVSDNAIKVAKGSERELATVDISTLHRTQQAITLAERNRVMRSVFEKVEGDAESFGFIKLGDELSDVGLPKTIKEADAKKAGFEKVSYFKEGVKEDWLVPTDLGVALKNLDAPQAGFIMKYLKIPADILRAGATRLNVAFSLSNFPRDLQTAAGISKEGFTKKQLVSAMNEVTNFSNPETRAFYEGGGAFGGLIGAEKPSRDILAASQRAPILNVGTNLAKAIETVGERVENATRFAVYKNAIAQGMPHELAIFEARNATVDFSKQGNVIGALNQVIPFLNARVQGMVNTVSSLNDDPTKFVRRQLFQSVYPAIYLYAHNNQYESFKNIPAFERDQNWIIMYGETDGLDNNGAPIKVPEYIKIRKGEVQSPAANAVEQYLDLSNRENPRDVKDFLQSQILNTSPVSMSSFGPLSTPIELTANYDLFTKAPIEPEFQEVVEGGKKFNRDEVPVELRMNRWTGETARQLSKKGLDEIGLSPARIEFIVGKIFGTSGKDLLRLVDMSQTGLDQTGVPDGEATKAQILSRTPIFRTFIGSNAAGEKIALYEIVKKVSQEQFDEIEMPRELEAMSIIEQATLINEKQGKEEANKYIRSLDLSTDMKARVKRIKENTDKGETNQKQIYDKLVGNSIKLRYLIENLNMIKSKEQKNAFVKDMVISKDLRKKLQQAKKEGLLKNPE